MSRVDVEHVLGQRWRAIRDDAGLAAPAELCIDFAYDVGLLTDQERELWTLRIATCPGHDDEGGRVWCSYCGDMQAAALRTVGR